MYEEWDRKVGRPTGNGWPVCGPASSLSRPCISVSRRSDRQEFRIRSLMAEVGQDISPRGLGRRKGAVMPHPLDRLAFLQSTPNGQPCVQCGCDAWSRSCTPCPRSATARFLNRSRRNQLGVCAWITCAFGWLPPSSSVSQPMRSS